MISFLLVKEYYQRPVVMIEKLAICEGECYSKHSKFCERRVNMKKLFSLFLAAVLCFSLVACGGGADGGHTCSGEWVVVEEATCLKEGSRQRTCSCGNVTTEAIPVLSHAYEEGICTLCNSADPNYKPEPSVGLEFKTLESGTCYLAGLGTCTDTDIVVPETAPNGDRVVAIGEYAFHYNDSVNSIWIPDSVRTIEQSAFYGSSNLTKVVIGNGVREIEDWAFCVCKKLEVLSMGNSVTTIEDSVFTNCSALTQVNLPQTLTSLGEKVFEGCKALAEVTIPDGVEEIEEYTFSGCSALQRVVLGSGIESIGKSAFKNCTELKSVYIADLKTWCNITFVNWEANPVYQGCDLYLGGQLLTDLVIPEDVTDFNDIFQGCTSLVSVTIPGTVEKIDNYAFSNCANLTTINLANGVKSIGKYAFRYCDSLTEVVIPESVTSVGDSAFADNSNLKKVTINATKVLPYNNQFTQCPALEEIHVPADLGVQYRSEYGWKNYKKILKFEGDQGDAPLTPSEGLEFTSNKNGTCRVTGIGTCTDSEIVIPETAPNGDTVVAIAPGAFERCSGISTVIIPKTVKEIGSYAFHYCSSLTSLDLPESVTRIGSGAFNNSSLTTLIIRSKTLVYSPYYNDPHDQGAIPVLEALYVPAELVETYQTTMNWSPLQDKIQPIAD